VTTTPTSPAPEAREGGPAGPVLVVDFGAQYAQLIARRVREARVYSEIVPHTMTAEAMLAARPAAIILSGGPASVYAEGAPGMDPAVFDAGVPVLGICYGFQVMARALGGVVGRTGTREYGRTGADVDTASRLFAGTPARQTVWMSHGDAVQTAPAGFAVTASTEQTPVAAFEDRSRRLFGLQWHPEVLHSEYGRAVLANFLHDGAGIAPTWTPGSIIDEQVAAIRERVGEAHVICGLSGGVDSSVAAALVHRAIGDRLTCIFVDHGLLRAGEREQVEHDYARGMGIRVIAVDESERFLAALAGGGDRWAGVPRPPIGSFCCGAPRAEFLVEAEDAVAVIADQFDPTDDRGDRGFLLDLLVDEPVQQWQGVDVVGGVGEAVEATDGLGHLLLVGEGGFEGLEDRGDVLGLGLDGAEQRGGVAIQHVGDELVRVHLFLGGLGLEPVRDARQIEGIHVDGKLPVHDSSLQLHGDLSVECFFEFSSEFHARETNLS